MRKSYSLTVLIWLAVLSVQAQIKFISPTTRQYAHMGESVAQYGEYSVLGAYEDGTPTTSHTGAIYVYKNGTLYRSYTLFTPANAYATLGRKVDITDTWIAGTSGNARNLSNPSLYGRVVLAKKSGADYATTMTYNIDLALTQTPLYIPIKISGNIMVLGNSYDNQKGNSAGAILIYQYNSTLDQWTFAQKITASDGAANAHFGYSVSIDGNTIVVGAPGANSNKGKLYVFSRSSTSLPFTQKVIRGEWLESINAPEITNSSRYGTDVDISGNNIIVSTQAAPDLGVIKLSEILEFNPSNSNLTLQTVFRNKGGSDVSISGNKAVVSDEKDGGNNGRVYMFKKVGTEWLDYGDFIPCDVQPGDQYGRSVAIHGDRICAGLKGYDSIGLYNIGSGYLFGFDAKASPTVDNASFLNIPNHPAEPDQFLVPEDRAMSTFFGFSMANSPDGHNLIVGDPFYKSLKDGSQCNIGSGAVHVYQQGSNGKWIPIQKIAPGYDYHLTNTPGLFGQHIATSKRLITQQIMAISAPNEETVYNTPYAGAVYLYRKLNSPGFVHHARLVHPQNASNKHFGSGGVATNGDYVVVATFSTQQLSLYSITETGATYISDTNMGISGTLLGMTSNGIVVVAQGNNIKFYGVGTNGLIPVALPNPGYNAQFTGQVAVDQNGILMVTKAQYTNTVYQSLVLATYTGSGLTQTTYSLPNSLAYGTSERIRSVSFHKDHGFAVSFTDYRVAVYANQSGTYKMLDVYYPGYHTKNMLNPNSFGQRLVYMNNHLFISDMFNTKLYQANTTYSCHQCTGNSSYGIVGILQINQRKVDNVKKATVLYKPFDSEYNSKFGSSVAMNNYYTLVGAPNSYNGSNNSGSVTVFDRANNMKVLTTLVPIEQNSTGSNFGHSIDIGSQYAAISNTGNGGNVTVYEIHQLANSTIEAYFINPNPSVSGFGSQVATWQNYVVVNSPYDNKVYVYKRESSYWTLKQIITPPTSNGLFGLSIDIENNYLVIGDPVSKNPDNTSNGKAFIYTLNSSGIFVHTQTLSAPTPLINGRFGEHVAISEDYIAVSSTKFQNSKVSIFQKSGTTWTLLTEVSHPSISTLGKMSFYHERLMINQYGSGKILLFTRNGSGYSIQGEFDAGSNALFSLTQHDSRMLVGAAAYATDQQGVAYAITQPSFIMNSNLRKATEEHPAEHPISGQTEFGNTYTIYPNPSSGKLLYTNYDGIIKTAKAVAINGQITELSISEGALDVSSLTPGMYTIMIETADNTLVQPFVKQ
jgi:hypothetical protein